MKEEYRIKSLTVILITLFLTACGGENGSNTVPAASEPNRSTEDKLPANENQLINKTDIEDFFTQEIQPSLDYCRTCHIPDGIGDVEEGSDFLLSLEETQDYNHFYESWDILGQGIEENEILTRNADPNLKHTGGKLWPENSDIYQNLAILFACWSEDETCVFNNEDNEDDETDEGSDQADNNPNQFPLLGSSHGKHIWDSFCEAAADNTPLPVDPRTLVIPGANEGKAVHFNTYYENCHINLPEEEGPPKTCGEYKARVATGYWFANQRAAGADMAYSAEDFNELWKEWGFDERPENFETLLTERYGLNPAPFHNPYPLPGEDPASTDGGSGQLPMGLIQTKNSDGVYNGKIATNCYICHGGQIGYPGEGEGLGPIPGMGNTNTDFILLGRDLSSGIIGALPFTLGSVRGTSNAVGAFDMLAMAWDVDTLSLSVNPFTLPWDHPYHGNQDMPNWWNVSHRPRKFFDAGLSVDSTRIDMAAADQINILGMTGKERREATEKYDQDLQAYVDSQVAPPFPGVVDEQLAEQGAIIFHNKNLWAEQGNAHLQKPGGNGSCASCHGAYSPRFVNDKDYLDDPSMEGLAAHLVPLELIGTDPNRALSLAPITRQVFGGSWWGYPEGMPGYIPPEEKSFVEEFLDDVVFDEDTAQDRVARKGACGWEENIGYLAPPLYGIWGSSPYFHNGVVPTLRQVLRSHERPAVWSRFDTPDEDLVFRGYDMSLRSYDLDNEVGWKHQTYCTEDGGLPTENCDGEWVNRPAIYKWLDSLKQDIWFFGFLSAPYDTQEGIEARKIVNTFEFGNSNAGHEFTDVLTDQEVEAVIEYLKTL